MVEYYGGKKNKMAKKKKKKGKRDACIAKVISEKGMVVSLWIRGFVSVER